MFARLPVRAGDQDFIGRTVREIRILGLDSTPESVVREQLASRVGQPYRPETTRLDVERLDRLGVFSEITVSPVASADGVAIEVALRETLRYFPYPSIDVSDENGLSAGIGVKSAGFLGKAVDMSATVRVGGSTHLVVEAESPWRLRLPLWYGIRLEQDFRTNELDHFEETATQVDARLGRQIGANLRFGGQFRLLSLNSDTPGVTLSPDNRDNIPGLGAIVAYDTRDSWSNPHRGWWNELEVTQNGGFLGGDGDYLSADVDIRRYQPLGARHTLLVTSLATFQTGDVGGEIPIYEDFHIGGTGTVRGWDIDARHGKNQFINTAEYRYEVMRPRAWRLAGLNFSTGFQLAVFGDLGTVWDAGYQFRKNFIGGAGVGFRIVLPHVQLIRFDFAFGQSGSGPHFHFGFDEKAVQQRRRIR